MNEETQIIDPRSPADHIFNKRMAIINEVRKVLSVDSTSMEPLRGYLNDYDRYMESLQDTRSDVCREEDTKFIKQLEEAAVSVKLPRGTPVKSKDPIKNGVVASFKKLVACTKVTQVERIDKTVYRARLHTYVCGRRAYRDMGVYVLYIAGISGPRVYREGP